MAKPKLYLAGAITGMPDLNRTKFKNGTRQLRDLGYIVVNPHEVCSDLSEEDWNLCMRRCIGKLVECDRMVLLDDWQQSRGANLEFTIAKQLGLEPISINEFLKLGHNEIYD